MMPMKPILAFAASFVTRKTCAQSGAKMVRVGIILSHFDLLQVYELRIKSLQIVTVRIEWEKF
jgi:hypothetical protein